MPDSVAYGCARIFREVVSDSQIEAWNDAQLLVAPLEKIDVDSLTFFAFVMQVEDAYNVELNETAVSNCRTIGELAALVTGSTPNSVTHAAD